MATVAGLFERYEDADLAITQLNEKGFGRDSINVIAPEEKVGSKLTGKKDASEDTAVTGALVGGLAGLLVGVGTILIPGVGTLLTAGALATALGSTAVGAGIGAAAGSLRGTLEESGIPEVDAVVIEEGIRNGGILVTVIAEGDQIRQVKDIMRASNSIDLKTRRNIRERGRQDEDNELTAGQE